MSQHVDAIDLSIEAAIAAATSRSLDIEVLQNPKSNNDLTYNLIEAVRQEPSLYDPNDEHYGNKNSSAQYRSTVWQRLCKQLNFEGDSQSLQAKWKRIRDRYVRERKKKRVITKDKAYDSAYPYTTSIRFLESMNWIDEFIGDSHVSPSTSSTPHSNHTNIGVTFNGNNQNQQAQRFRRGVKREYSGNMRNSSNDPLSTKIIGNGFNGNQLPATFLVPQQGNVALPNQLNMSSAQNVFSPPNNSSYMGNKRQDQTMDVLNSNNHYNPQVVDNDIKYGITHQQLQNCQIGSPGNSMAHFGEQGPSMISAHQRLQHSGIQHHQQPYTVLPCSPVGNSNHQQPIMPQSYIVPISQWQQLQTAYDSEKGLINMIIGHFRILSDDEKAVTKINIQRILMDARFGRGACLRMFREEEQSSELASSEMQREPRKSLNEPPHR